MNRKPLRLFSSLCAAFSLFAGPSLARPTDTYIAMEPMAGKKVRVDGMLKEWPDGFAKLETTLRGSASRTTALVGYDNASLYFALTTDDSKIARTPSASKN